MNPGGNFLFDYAVAAFITLLFTLGIALPPDAATIAERDVAQVQQLMRYANQIRSDGATVYYAPSNGGTLLTIYRGEPDGTAVPAPIKPLHVRTPLTINGATTGALIIDPNGTMRPDAGITINTAVAAAPPACITTVDVTSTRVPGQVLATLDCTGLSL